MSRISASPLARRYVLLVAACALPLLLLVGALGLHQYDAQRQAEFQALAAAVSETRLVVERVVQDASDHLVQLKVQAEDLLAERTPAARQHLRSLLVPSHPPDDETAIDGLTLDGSDSEIRRRFGNIFLAADRSGAAVPGELETALALFEPMRLTHLVKPHLRWSYYFSASGAFITMFPFIGREEIVEDFGHPSIGAMIDHYRAYEVYLDTTPARNPELAPTWTAPYLDAAGAGWMVSHSMSVEQDGRFVGTLGTDLLLSYLDETLARLPLRAGRLWIVGEEGELIADRGGTPLDGDEARNIRSVLPQELRDALPGLPLAGQHQMAGYRIIATPVDGTPWTLLFVVSEVELLGIVRGSILPYGLILIGLLASIFVAHFALRAQFIRPAIALTEHLEAESLGTASDLRVPQAWLPWFDRISAIFREKRESMRQLAASEEHFRSVFEAITEFVIRFRPDGRLTFANDAYCRHLGISRDALLSPDWNEFDLLSPTERRRQNSYFQTLTPDSPVGRIEVQVNLPDGRVVWEEWTDLALFDEKGQQIEIQSVGRDVTDRRLAQIALAESEQRYRSVVEAQTEFVVRMTPEGRLTFVNDAYCRYYGRSRDELLSPEWCEYDVLPESEKQRFLEHLSRLTPEEPAASIELMGTLPGGPPLWSAWTDRGIFDDEGRLIEIQSVGRDITQLVIAEQARQETERLRQTVLEAALDGYVGIDHEGAVIEFNAAAETIFGYRRDEVLGRRMVDLIVPEDLRRKHNEAFERHLATGESKLLGRRIEVPAQRSDGSIFPIELVIVRGTAAEKPVFIAYLRDLTEQKKAAAALAEREAQFRAIAEGVPLPIIISALDEPEVFFVNETAQRLLGLQVGQARQQVLAVWKTPEHRVELARRLERERIVDAFETTFIRFDGAEMQALVSARRVEYDGRPAVLAAVTDISRQREAEAEIAQQREALHQSEKLTALGSLLAGVAHELNNPLSVVVGYSSMLRELTDDPAITGRAERIHAAAERCSRIVRTFLAMARKRPPSRGAVKLDEVAKAAVELAAYGLRSAGIEVALELEPDLPKIWGDEDQLHQVVTNLVINAQQAMVMTDGPRRLRLSTRSAGDLVEIAVEDSGPGMPEEVRARIFEPFFTTKTSGVGTGVGLSVCKAIVTAHEGHIEVESAPGEGTRIVVRLPAGLPRDVDDDAEDEPAGETPRWSANVLVIDDEPDIAAMVCEMLRRDGHVVAIAKDAESALRMIERADVDLVVSDLRMPGLDGPGLYRAIRETRPELIERLLFITGDVLAPDIDRFLAETGAVVVEKPLDPGLFRRVVAGRLAEMEGEMA